MSSLATVRKAAKLAVYEALMMVTTAHQQPATTLPEKDRGLTSGPCNVKYNTLSTKESTTNICKQLLLQNKIKVLNIVNWKEDRKD